MRFEIPAQPDAVAFSPDGRFLATAGAAPSAMGAASDNGQLLIFAVNPRSGALRNVAAISPGQQLGDVAFDPTADFLVIPGPCGIEVLAFNHRSGTLREASHSKYSTGEWCATEGRFDPAGDVLAVARGLGDGVWFYTVNGQTGRLSKTAAWSDGSQSFAGEVSFSPDGGLLAVPLFDDCGVAVLWVKDAHKVAKVSGSPFLIRSCPDVVAFSPDGRMLAALVGPHPEKLALLSFDEQTGAIQHPLSSPVATGGNFPKALAFSPNGRFVVVGNGVAYGHESVSVFLVPSACPDPDDDNDCDG